MPTPVLVQFVGAGDAFGSGGRFQTCISLHAPDVHVLLDCGATSLVALRRLGLDPLTVDAVLLTHLHGDHFGGLPFLVLDAQFGRRERPLLVAGPPGTAERVTQAMEVLFPASSRTRRRFELRFLELPAGEPTALDLAAEPTALGRASGPVDPGLDQRILTAGSSADLSAVTAEPGVDPAVVADDAVDKFLVVTAYPVVHPSGAPAYALRVACAGRIVAYSGDTEWTEALLDAARDADLFICEAYSYEKAIKYHLSYATLRAKRTRLGCRRLVLTHPSPDLLARRADLADQLADDGLTIAL